MSEPEGVREPTAIGELLGRMASARGWQERLAAGRLRVSWAEVVGEQVASRSEPLRLERGVLVVGAQSGAWATELSLLAPSLARTADEFLGGGVVREVRVVVREAAPRRPV